MFTDGTDLRSLFAHVSVSAVPAFPYGDLIFLENKALFDVLEKCQISFFMCLLNSTYTFKSGSDLVETFLSCRLCELGKIGRASCRERV